MKISYITSHGVGEWYEFEESSSDTLTVRIKPECSGALLLGSSTYAVDGGIASIPLRSLKDGEYHPRLECKLGCFALSGFTKHGRGVTPLPSDAIALRRLIKECFLLRAAEENLAERVAHLEDVCLGNSILTFERKNK